MNKKQLKNILLVKSGLAALKRESNRVPRVLFYHGVAEVHAPLIESLHIAPPAFQQQVAYIQKHYEPVSMDEYWQRWKSGTFTGREVTFTFDDGYKNNLTTVAPILRESGISFTVFVSTSHMDGDKRFATFIVRALLMHKPLLRITIPEMGMDAPLASFRQRAKLLKTISRKLKHSDIKTVNDITERLIGHLSPGEYQRLCDSYQADAPMNWEEVVTLQKQFDCAIGSHCIDHFICDSFQEENEIQRQIFESKAIIEEKLGRPCLYLAYPNGNTCEAAVNAARKAGYRLAFTTDNHRIINTSPFAMPRYGVNFDLNTFITDMAYLPR